MAIAPHNHALARKKSICLNDFAKEPFILREQGSGTRMVVDRFFKLKDLNPRVRLNLGSNEAIKQAVAGGLGCAVISRHALHGDPEDKGVVLLNVEGFPIQSQWFIVHLRGKKLSPVALVFRDYLRVAAKDMFVKSRKPSP